MEGVHLWGRFPKHLKISWSFVVLFLWTKIMLSFFFFSTSGIIYPDSHITTHCIWTVHGNSWWWMDYSLINNYNIANFDLYRDLIYTNSVSFGVIFVIHCSCFSIYALMFRVCVYIHSYCFHVQLFKVKHFT